MNQSSSKFFTQIAVIAGFFLGVMGIIVFAASNFVSNDANSNLKGTLLVWGTLPESQMTKIFYQYSQNAKTYTVKYKEIPENVFTPRYVEATARGEAPDLIIASENILFPLRNYLSLYTSEILSETDFKTIFARNTYQYYGANGTFALPVATDPLVMYVNLDILQNAGFSRAPTNWIDIPIYVKQVLDLNKTSNISELRAVAMGTFSNVLYAREIVASLLMQLNNDVIVRNFEKSDNNGKIEYIESYEAVLGLKDARRNINNNSNAELVFNFFSSFVNPNFENAYTWSRRAPTDRDLFASGGLGLYFGLASDKQYIDLKNPNLKYEVAMLPIPKAESNKFLNTNYARVYGVSMSSKNSNITLSQKVMTDISDTNISNQISQNLNIAPAREKELTIVQGDTFKAIVYKSAQRGKFVLEPSVDILKNLFSTTADAFLGSRSTPVEIINKTQDELSNIVTNK